MTTYLPMAEISDSEVDKLDSALAEIGSPMSPESLDGFFVALICTPELIMPSVYLPWILGKDHDFESEEQAVTVLDMISRHWNATIARLDFAAEQGAPYIAIFADDMAGAEWATGFFQGIRISPNFWNGLLSACPDTAGNLSPIIELAREVDPDPAERSDAITPERRRELVESIRWSAVELYTFGKDVYRKLKNPPIQRGRQKVGRNDPCPCGSGHKYKRCCALGEPTIH